MSYHTIILVGRLGRDPEMRYTATGQAVTTFSVATDHRYTDSEGKLQRITTWFTVTVWGKQAENCNNFLQKGRMVLVEGRLRSDPETHGPRTYTKTDGTPGSKYEVTAQTVRFLSAKGEGGEATPGAPAGGDEFQEMNGDDLQF